MNWDIKITKNLESKINKTDFNHLSFGHDFTDHMFIADYYNDAWRDCRIVPFENLSMHPASFVLHYGQSIFEGLKAERSEDNKILIFRPEANAARFTQSAIRMSMPPVPEDLFLQSINELVSMEKEWVPKDIPNTSLYIRPFLFGTDPFLGVKTGDTYRFVVIVGPSGAYYSDSVNVWIQNKYVRAFPGGTGAAKFSGNYSPTLLPVAEAKKHGCAQILWTDGIEHKYFQEIGTMNVFFQINDTLLTPSLDEGTILHGITRDSLIKIAKENGISVEERRISVDEILDAYNNGTLKDMFGAGTAAVVNPIDGFVLNDIKYDLSLLERKTSKFLKKTLEDIKKGIIEDKFNWVTVLE